MPSSSASSARASTSAIITRSRKSSRIKKTFPILKLPETIWKAMSKVLDDFSILTIAINSPGFATQVSRRDVSFLDVDVHQRKVTLWISNSDRVDGTMLEAMSGAAIRCYHVQDVVRPTSGDPNLPNRRGPLGIMAVPGKSNKEEVFKTLLQTIFRIYNVKKYVVCLLNPRLLTPGVEVKWLKDFQPIDEVLYFDRMQSRLSRDQLSSFYSNPYSANCLTTRITDIRIQCTLPLPRVQKFCMEDSNIVGFDSIFHMKCKRLHVDRGCCRSPNLNRIIHSWITGQEFKELENITWINNTHFWRDLQEVLDNHYNRNRNRIEPVLPQDAPELPFPMELETESAQPTVLHHFRRRTDGMLATLMAYQKMRQFKFTVWYPHCIEEARRDKSTP